VELEDWVFFFLGFQALTSQVFVILNTSFVVVTILVCCTALAVFKRRRN
jgi:hypothetical protein